jgi:hypothetical protein
MPQGPFWPRKTFTRRRIRRGVTALPQRKTRSKKHLRAAAPDLYHAFWGKPENVTLLKTLLFSRGLLTSLEHAINIHSWQSHLSGYFRNLASGNYPIPGNRLTL